MTGQGQEQFFCTDSAVVRGRIVDYSPTMGFQNLTAQVTDIFTGELKTRAAFPSVKLLFITKVFLVLLLD